MVEGHSLRGRIVDTVLYLVLILMAISCIVPLIHVMARSLSSYAAIQESSVVLWPVGLNFDNYKFLMTTDRLFMRTFVTSLARVLTGVTLTLSVTLLTGYVLSRGDSRHIPGLGVFKFVMLFSMLFSGGLIPVFLAYNSLGLIDNFAVLVLPGALNVFYTIIMANFFRGLPAELVEAAILDGANDFDLLFRIFVPVSLPALATITVFSAVEHWNSWFDGLIFMKLNTKWPLQSYLYSRVTQQLLQSRDTIDPSKLRDVTSAGLTAAMIVMAALPIMLVYPFAQKYFIKGLTLGSVKN